MVEDGRVRVVDAIAESKDQYIIALASEAATKPLQLTELDYHHPSELQSDKDIQEAPGFTTMRHEVC
ncbi:hypothetical protein N7533_001573 [Penicillium manginii]|uniref:uncharacterized protein n=1 Tax=Penicillium manginii TaxID=203109 RepID=UPI002546E906|nr:uncharacterized protein N7533_001573 [Penicillium manginii]KAJ5762892.1 hypothetical protein N7533_001573 [Penicillium manginii]